ncbi:DUF4082 domain-containing protein [Rhizobium phage RHph_TM16]|nr:DUF4082 domain-containing protein [Rhizobium phage RHph_TM16]
MAMTFIGAATGSTTVTIPAHQAGDLLVVFAFRDGNTTAPTLPTNVAWQNKTTFSTTSCSARLAYFIATGSGTTSGTWTSATSMIILVYRPTSGFSLSLGTQTTATGTTTSFNWPARTAQKTDGTSTMVRFAGHRNTDSDIETGPTGWTQRATRVNGTTDEVSAHDLAAITADVAIFSKTLTGSGTGVGWLSATVEVIETRIVPVADTDTEFPKVSDGTTLNPTTTGGQKSWTGVGIGTAASTRVVGAIVRFVDNLSAPMSVLAATIGGIAANITGPSATGSAYFISAVVPTGTTADIVCTTSAGTLQTTDLLGVFVFDNVGLTPVSFTGTASTSASISGSAPDNSQVAAIMLATSAGDFIDAVSGNMSRTMSNFDKNSRTAVIVTKRFANATTATASFTGTNSTAYMVIMQEALVTEEWLHSGLGLGDTYSGTENSDGGNGVVLATEFCALKAGYITHIRFWKVSTDTATSRPVGLFNHSGTLVASATTSGEPTGTAQWITVALDTPLAVSDAAPLTTQTYYAAVLYSPERYPATGSLLDSGHYSANSKLYTPAGSSESVANGGVGNGAFKYVGSPATLQYPDGNFNNTYYWVDVKWAASLGGTTTPKSISISVTTTVTEKSTVGKNLAITAATTVSVLKRVNKTLAITSSLTTAVKKAVGKMLSINAATSVTPTQTPATNNPAWNPSTSNNVDTFSSYQGVANARAVTGEKGGVGSGINTDEDLLSSTGKLYFEIDLTNIDTAGGWGDISYLVLQSIEGDGYIYLAYDNGPATSYIQDQINTVSRNLSAPLADGDNVGFAIDNTIKKAWFRINGGAWQDATDATGNDPATGAGGIDYSAVGFIRRMSFQTSRGNYDISLRTNSAVYAGPEGFTTIAGTMPWINHPAWDPTAGTNATYTTAYTIPDAYTAAIDPDAASSAITDLDLIPTTGKYFIEVRRHRTDAQNNEVRFGLQNSSGSVSAGLIYTTVEWDRTASKFRQDGSLTSDALVFPYAVTVGFALDNDNKKLWILTSSDGDNNPIWEDFGGADGDPTTNTGGITLSEPLTAIFADATNGPFEIIIKPYGSTNPLPSGFTYVDGTTGQTYPAWDVYQAGPTEAYEDYFGVEKARSHAGVTTFGASTFGTDFATAYGGYPDTGKYYFELDILDTGEVGSYSYVGMGAFGPGGYFEIDRLEDGTGYLYWGDVATDGERVVPAYENGDTVCFAVDQTAKKVWWRINNGDWRDHVDDTGVDPATGTGGAVFTYPPLGQIWGNSQSSTAPYFDVGLRTNSSAYDVPSGFLYLDGSSSSTSTPLGLTINAVTTVFIQKQVLKGLTINATTTGSVKKGVSKAVPITATTTVSPLKGVTKKLAVAAVTTVAALTPATLRRTLSIAASTTVATVKRTNKSMLVTATTSVTAVKAVAKSLLVTATTTASALATKAFLKVISITATTTVSSKRSVSKLVAITAAPTLAVQRGVSKFLTITPTITVNAAKGLSKAILITVTTTTSATALRAFLKTITINVSTSVTTSKRTLKNIALIATLSVSTVKAVSKSFLITAATSVTTVASRTFLKAILIAASATVSARKTASVTLIVISGTTVTAVKRVGLTALIPVTTTVAVTKSIGKKIAILATITASAIAQFVAAVSGPVVKVWDGTAYKVAKLKVWNGVAWIIRNISVD